MWLRVAPDQVDVEWHDPQLVLIALLCGVAWQAEQVVGVPL